jgi:hypothetical protein
MLSDRGYTRAYASILDDGIMALEKMLTTTVISFRIKSPLSQTLVYSDHAFTAAVKGGWTRLDEAGRS